jgi:MFS superfamily sulfate permease-like transporter
MVELISQYLRYAKKVKGVYILRVPVDLDYMTVKGIKQVWDEMVKKKKIKEPLMIIPTTSQLTYIDSFSFSQAMKLVISGALVTRKHWNTKAFVYKKKQYDDTNSDEYLNFYDGNGQSHIYCPTIDDLQAQDWSISSMDKATSISPENR